MQGLVCIEHSAKRGRFLQIKIIDSNVKKFLLHLFTCLLSSVDQKSLPQIVSKWQWMSEHTISRRWSQPQGKLLLMVTWLELSS